ncbi:MAG: hypothetical protein JOY91_06915 [Sinobacteraceae bacterium]|nr:hypothetical protein [Nevskiaceae bacterium]
MRRPDMALARQHALTDPNHRVALLAEAARLIDGLKPSIRGLRDVQMWRSFIAREQHA